MKIYLIFSFPYNEPSKTKLVDASFLQSIAFQLTWHDTLFSGYGRVYKEEEVTPQELLYLQVQIPHAHAWTESLNTTRSNHNDESTNRS
jgi:exonuclease I